MLDSLISEKADAFITSYLDPCDEDADCFLSLSCENNVCRGLGLNMTCGEEGQSCDLGLICDVDVQPEVCRQKWTKVWYRGLVDSF